MAEGLKITVGASLDRSTLAVFTQMAEAHKRAAAQISSAEKRTADEGARVAREAAKAFERGEREKTRVAEREARARAAAEGREMRQMEREAARAASNRTAIDRQRSREVMRALREQAADEKRIGEQRIRDQKSRERHAARESQAFDRQAGQGLRSGLGLAGRGLRFAAGVGRDLLQGVGVDTSFSSMVGKNVSLEAAATDLTNQAYQPGKGGAAAIRQDPRALMQESFGIGTRTGYGANEVMGGMTEFVKLTGDLETARATMERLAMLSKATGASLEDMAGAAANVSNALGDTPDKARVVDEAMRQIAGQGKLGAVEIRDLATQMGKVAAFAPLMAGDTARNIQTFGGMAQMARHSGATSASQAAQSVLALMAQFGKGKRIEAFRSYGVSTTDEATGKIRNVEQVLPEAFAAAARRHGGIGEGFRLGMTSMIYDQQAQRASRGYQRAFSEAYTTAGGTQEQKIQAGVDAVAAAFKEMRLAVIREAELKESFNAAMETTKSKSEQWNNAIQQATLELQDKLVPLLPVLVDAMKGLLGGVKAVVDFLIAAGILKKEDKSAAKAGAGGKAVALTDAQLMEGIKKGELTKDQYDQATTLAAQQRKNLEAQKANANDPANQHGAASKWVRGTFGLMHENLPEALGGQGAGIQMLPLFAALGDVMGKGSYAKGKQLDALDANSLQNSGPGEAQWKHLADMEGHLAEIKRDGIKITNLPKEKAVGDAPPAGTDQGATNP